MPKRRVEIDEQEVKRLCTQESLSAKQIADTLGVPRYADKIKGILAGQGIEILCWCGIGLKGHTRCAGCGILVGPEHVTKTIERYRGRGYCADCLKGRKKSSPNMQDSK